MKVLNDVTLLAVSSIKIEETLGALIRSCECIQFAEVKLITHELPNILPNNIRFEQCPKLNNINDYNLYTFKYMSTHVNTSHCLLIQYDSWVIRPELWNDDWLQYDYVAAPWAYKDDAYICHDTGEHVRVGNGGFSLRSKKLIDTPMQYSLPLLQEQGWYNEDGNICCYHRKRLLELGIKYAPVDVASVFSFETEVPENKNTITFGFHRNMR